jgi:hypothetical protein
MLAQEEGSWAEMNILKPQTQTLFVGCTAFRYKSATVLGRGGSSRIGPGAEVDDRTMTH